MDIFNSDSLSPYKDLVVASEWLNSEGLDIVRHLVDNAPNKPPEDQGGRKGSGGSQEQKEEEEEEQEEAVEDLISGLDDDSA